MPRFIDADNPVPFLKSFFNLERHPSLMQLSVSVYMCALADLIQRFSTCGTQKEHDFVTAPVRHDRAK